MNNANELVRQYVAGMGTATTKEVRRDLGLDSTSAGKVLSDLVRKGHLTRVARGTYQVNEVPQRKGAVCQQIWAAMRINPTFAVSDLSRQAGTSDHYARKIMRRYMDAGYVQNAGRRKTYGSGSEKLWRLVGKAKELRQAPVPVEFQPDPLTEDVCRLTRLICTGQATRLPGKRDQAIQLCEKITDELRKN